MASAIGLGAVVGALVTAGRGRTGLRALTIGAAAFELLTRICRVAGRNRTARLPQIPA